MRRAFNVRLAFVSSVVFFADSVVISEKQNVRRQELSSSVQASADQLASLLRADLAKELASSERVSSTERLASLLRADLAKARASSNSFERASSADILASLLRRDLAKAAAAKAAARAQVGSKNPHNSEEHAELLLPETAIKMHSSGSAGEVSWKGKLKAWASEHPIVEEMVSPLKKVFLSVFVWAVLTLLLGTFYHHEKLHPPKLDPEGVNVSLHDRERLDRHRWRFGLFEHTEVPSLYCFSFFCAPIRWADTMRMAGFMHYYSALALAVGLTVLGYLTLGIGFIVLLCICVHFRERMKQKFEIRSQTSDWLAFIFCPWCSITQEARQMEEAYLARHPSIRHEYQSTVVRLPARKI